MPDLTPDVTTTPNFDPGRVAIASEVRLTVRTLEGES